MWRTVTVITVITVITVVAVEACNEACAMAGQGTDGIHGQLTRGQTAMLPIINLFAMPLQEEWPTFCRPTTKVQIDSGNFPDGCGQLFIRLLGVNQDWMQPFQVVLALCRRNLSATLVFHGAKSKHVPMCSTDVCTVCRS